MKRKSNLYMNLCNYNNIKYNYRIIKSKCRNKKKVYNFDKNVGNNLYNILVKLIQKKYEFSHYSIFLIKEPKYRLIMSENISDKIVNHLISNCILLPALEHKLIDSNVATRKNKGSSYAYKLLIKYLNSYRNEANVYILKIDIKKYFYNINHILLIEMLEREIKDKDALNIIKKTLNTTNQDYINECIDNVINKEIDNIKYNKRLSLKEKQMKILELKKIPRYKKNKGLGIGNMTSQVMAVYFLNDVNHYIKEVLRIKHYIRYMDDLVFINKDKEKLIGILQKISIMINKKDLEINSKSQIYSLSHGFNFLGYTYKKIDNTLLIKINNQTLHRIKRHLKNLKKMNPEKLSQSIISYKGLFMRTSKYNDYYFKETVYCKNY